MASAGLRNSVILLAAAGLLMGCVEGAGSGTGDTTKAAPSVSRSGSAQEVEAPEVYQVTDSALWDGRPSLGGIWVAAPDVVDPERVVILNPATGKSVTGALFRRERDNPGPRLQVSSDAAEALGMLAGQPTSLRVTALRKASEPEPVVTPAEDTAVAAADNPEAATAAGDPAAAETAAAETAALATAALAATDGTAEAAADTGAAASAAVDGAAAAGAEAAVTEPPKKKTWKERRAEAKAKREAEKAAKAAAAAAAAAAEGTATGEPAATADEAAVASVETAPLDARNPDAVSALPAATATAEPETAPATKPAAEPAPAPAAGPARSIQIASFSKEDNAKRAVEALAKVSVTAEVRRSEQGGKVVWGVVTSGDETQLAAIKKAGFADAFFLD